MSGVTPLKGDLLENLNTLTEDTINLGLFMECRDKIRRLRAENSRKENVLIRIKGQCETEMAGDRNSAFKYIAELADSVLSPASTGHDHG